MFDVCGDTVSCGEYVIDTRTLLRASLVGCSVLPGETRKATGAEGKEFRHVSEALVNARRVIENTQQ